MSRLSLLSVRYSRTFSTFCSLYALAFILLGTSSAFAQLPSGTWQYHWGDEFTEETLDTTKWSYNYPWGNTHNHDAYMSPDNVLLGDGTMTLLAERKAQGGKAFTSGAISSGYSKFRMSSGYIEANIKLPSTPGSWPAFWGLNDGWPPETDIMEYPIDTAAGVGYAEDEYHTAYHYRNSSGGNSAGAGKVNPSGIGDLGDTYHTFGLEWREDDWMGFYIDGQRVSEYGGDSEIAQMQSMYLIFNYAVGGWPGTPSTTEWSSRHSDTMKVDWVRVWNKASSKTTNWANTSTQSLADWNSSGNWSNGSPNLGGVTANFGTINASAQRIEWDNNRTVSNINFSGTTGYQIGKTGSGMTLVGADNATGSVRITNTSPASRSGHAILANIDLFNELQVTNTSPSQILFSGKIRGNRGITLDGTGIVRLTGTNSYQGDTNIESGTLALSAWGSIAKTPTINLHSGATLHVSTTVSGGMILADQTLVGSGQVVGNLFSQGSTIQVGNDGSLTEAAPIFLDDFNDTSLSEYTETRILDQGSTDNVSFSSPNGVLQAVSSGSDGAEQTVLLRDDYQLAVGQELRADTNINSTASLDFGIIVAADADPTELTRSDYATIFMRNSTSHVGASGFNGTTDVGLIQDSSGSAKDALFIARTADNRFEFGYYVGDQRTVVTTRRTTNNQVGSAIGFYADLRENATFSGFENLSITDIENLVFQNETLDIDGNLTLDSASSLQLNILEPGTVDRVEISGDFAAAGTLEISLAELAASPEAGDAFDIIGFASATGQFDSFILPGLANGLEWVTQNLLTTGVLEVAATLPGDYNNDGNVDAADYPVWRDNVGASAGSLPHDIDGGTIGAAQYNTWVANYGATSASNSYARSLAVPEPTSLCLLLLTGVGCSFLSARRA